MAQASNPNPIDSDLQAVEQDIATLDADQSTDIPALEQALEDANANLAAAQQAQFQAQANLDAGKAKQVADLQKTQVDVGKLSGDLSGASSPAAPPAPSAE